MALQGECVGCYTSPASQYRRQQADDMRMSPFTSIQRIQAHLSGAHGLGEGDVNEAITKMSHGIDIHAHTNQVTWRSLHGALHASGEADHDESAAHTSSDPFDVFNDRRG
jgi:hypothetical protein